MADQKDTHIKVTADNSQAKATLQEINELVDTAQRKINQAFNSVQNNNGFVSNKAVAGAQNGIGDLHALQRELQSQLDNARSTQIPEQAQQTEASIAPKLDRIAQALQQLNQVNAGKMSAINSAQTTSSRAFRENVTVNGVDYGTQNINNDIDMRTLRSDLNNFMSSLRRTGNNWSEAQQTGNVSYNRYQEYRASLDNSNERFNDLRYNLSEDKKGIYGRFSKQFQDVQEEAKKASNVASRAGASREEVERARALDEQVKEMSKVNDQYRRMQAILEKGNQRLNGSNGKSGLAGSINNANNVNVGIDPNSFWGQIKQRSFSIARGAVAGGAAGITGAMAMGTNLRLNSFDDIKSTAYANGGRDNMVQNRLGDLGFHWGYSGADMAQFQNAFTSSTGNTDRFGRNAGGGAAEAWARQSRVLGGATQQSTLQLEQAAGNANGMTGSEMRRLGNTVTNSILNSNMEAKASQQQAGLAQMYQNGSPYGMSQSDLRNMAGFQASMSRYGSQFQGTQFAQQTQQMAQGLGNWQNPIARQMFAMGNPSRYQGVEGQAREEEDMQNLQKQPWRMRRVIQNAYRMSGNNKEIAAQTLSNVTGVSMATTKKWIDAANNGDMSQSQFEKYVKKTKKSGSQADQGFSKTGASKLLKYNASLADSAIKASHALDGFAGMLSKVMKHSGGFGAGIAGLAGGTVGSIAQNFIGDALWSWGKGKNWRALKGLRNVRSIKDFKSVMGSFRNAEKGATGATFRNITRGTRGKVNSVLRSASGLKGRIGKRLAQHEAERMAGNVGKKGLKGILKGIPGIGTVANLGFAGWDALHGDWGNTAFDLLGMIPGVGTATDVAQMFGAGDVADKALKGKLKGMSVKDARRYVARINRRRAGRTGLLGKLGRYGKYLLPGIGAGLLGMDLLGGTVHASTRRKNATVQSEDWKILRGYNKMLSRAMRVVQAAKSITSGDSKGDKSDGDISGTGGKGDKAIRSIAKAVAKKTGLDAKNIYAQLALESADGSSNESKTDNNFGGIKFANQPGATPGQGSPEGDNYAHFKNTDAFANAYAKILQADGLRSGMSPDEWASQLKKKGYFTADVGSYAAGLKTWVDKYAVGGMRFHATGGSLLADSATMANPTDIFGEAGTEAYTPLNAGHYNDGLANLKDLAGVFGKRVVDQSELSSNRSTTVNPNYNINLTINGGTDDPDSLAQKVASKVREMLSQYDQSQNRQMQHAYFANETSGLFV